MRAIANLLNHKGRVYIFVRSESLRELLQKNAEQEGFTFYGINSDLFILKNDWTLRGVGFVDHMCFHSMVKTMGDGRKIYRVDYGKYLAGEKRYFYKKPKKLAKKEGSDELREVYGTANVG